MHRDDDQVPRHESVDHEHPTDAGLIDDEDVPGTGILGDETVIRPSSNDGPPGIAPGTIGDPQASATTKRERSPIPPSH